MEKAKMKTKIKTTKKDKSAERAKKKAEAKKKAFQFKKGQSGNPSGRPPAPAEFNEFKKLTALKYKKLIEKYFSMTYSELAQEVKTKNLTILEAWLLKCIEQGMADSNYLILDKIMSRAIGHVSHKIDIETTATIKNDLSQIKTETLLKMASEAGTAIDVVKE
jgi:hypothetical protein